MFFVSRSFPADDNVGERSTSARRRASDWCSTSARMTWNVIPFVDWDLSSNYVLGFRRLRPAILPGLKRLLQYTIKNNYNNALLFSNCSNWVLMMMMNIFCLQDSGKKSRGRPRIHPQKVGGASCELGTELEDPLNNIL